VPRPGRMRDAIDRRSRISFRCLALSSTVAVAPLLGCATSLGGVATYAPTDPTSGHLGLDLEGHVPVPGHERIVVGGYAAHLFQVHPGTESDQGRLAAVIGYSDAPVPGQGALGFEAALRLGGFRGSNGPLVPLGALGIATVSPLVMLSARRPGVETATLSDVSWALAPYASAGILVPFENVQAELELGIGVALRAYLCAPMAP